MIILAAMAMTTLFVQANNPAPDMPTAAVETDDPTPIAGDTNGTEEIAPEGK